MRGLVVFLAGQLLGEHVEIVGCGGLYLVASPSVAHC